MQADRASTAALPQPPPWQHLPPPLNWTQAPIQAQPANYHSALQPPICTAARTRGPVHMHACACPRPAPPRPLPDTRTCVYLSACLCTNRCTALQTYELKRRSRSGRKHRREQIRQRLAHKQACSLSSRGPPNQQGRAAGSSTQHNTPQRDTASNFPQNNLKQRFHTDFQAEAVAFD